MAAMRPRAGSRSYEIAAADGSRRTIPQSVRSAPTAVGGYRFLSPPGVKPALVLCLLSVVCAQGTGVVVTPAELAEARRWSAARFEGMQQAAAAETALVVLANHGPVQKNARGGRPMHIVDKEYTRGLYCHAPSKIIVRLPGPGAKFTAIAGVDSNDQTSGGRGSVRSRPPRARTRSICESK